MWRDILLIVLLYILSLFHLIHYMHYVRAYIPTCMQTYYIHYIPIHRTYLFVINVHFHMYILPTYTYIYQEQDVQLSLSILYLFQAGEYRRLIPTVHIPKRTTHPNTRSARDQETILPCCRTLSRHSFTVACKTNQTTLKTLSLQEQKELAKHTSAPLKADLKRHKEELAEYKKQYAQSNREEQAEYQKQYREANREKINKVNYIYIVE